MSRSRPESGRHRVPTAAVPRHGAPQTDSEVGVGLSQPTGPWVPLVRDGTLQDQEAWCVPPSAGDTLPGSHVLGWLEVKGLGGRTAQGATDRERGQSCLRGAALSYPAGGPAALFGLGVSATPSRGSGTWALPSAGMLRPVLSS